MSKRSRQNTSEFQPVVPNITDESMRDLDPDVKQVKTMEERKRLQKEVNDDTPEPTFKSSENQQKSNTSKKEVQNSVGRSIIIGVLVIVITILVILLIYQVYKMLTVEENPLEVPPYDSNFSTNKQNYKENFEETYNMPNKPSGTEKEFSNKSIPDHVRDMDVSALSRYIKEDSTRKTNQPRDITQQTMIEDITPQPNKIVEEQRVSDIIDNAMKKDDTITIDSYDSSDSSDSWTWVR